MALERLDRAQQAARLGRAGDRRAVDRPGRDQRAAQVGGDVALGACRGDGVAEYLAARAAQPLGGLMAALAFHLAQHHQQLLR